MSPLWWLAIVPAAYVLVGYVIAWADAVCRVRAREACRSCGSQQHARECPCTECRNRTYVCGEHEVDDTGATLALWPLWLLFMAGDALIAVWGRVDPGKAVEQRAERKRMHVLVKAEREVSDG